MEDRTKSPKFLMTNLSCGLDSVKSVQDGGLRWSNGIKIGNTIWSYLMILVIS